MSDELFSVAGQNVLVTGGSRGIGRAIAEGFSKRGANVLICSRSQESVDTALQEMAESGLNVQGLACDVSDESQISATAEAAIARLGHLDTLINVAGVNRRKRAETVTPDDYDFIMNTNLRGAFMMSQAVGRHGPVSGVPSVLVYDRTDSVRRWWLFVRLELADSAVLRRPGSGRSVDLIITRCVSEGLLLKNTATFIPH
jgi:NAD(P)-dependent dehydrogenase (short-subunit alcohol dehydrogenase family)